MEIFDKIIDALMDDQYDLVVDSELSYKERIHTLQSWRSVYVNRLHLACLHNIPEKVDGFSRLMSNSEALLTTLSKACPGVPPIEEEDTFSGRVAALRGKMYHIFDEPNRPIEEYMTEMAACGICYLALSAAAERVMKANVRFEIDALRQDVCEYLDIVNAMIEAAHRPQN